uniref:hypothetical protein n=1 Tax=Moritella yayanosii TaxID=69539 RepID=UPI001E37C847|nr:hypothetical protein [Moritella yayanosii]
MKFVGRSSILTRFLYALCLLGSLISIGKPYPGGASGYANSHQAFVMPDMSVNSFMANGCVYLIA